jgi:hypothetical protein
VEVISSEHALNSQTCTSARGSEPMLETELSHVSVVKGQFEKLGKGRHTSIFHVSESNIIVSLLCRCDYRSLHC